MMKRVILQGVVLLVSALAAGALHATGTPEPTLADIRTQQSALRSQVVGARGAFKDMSERQRADLVARQDQVLQMTAGVDDVGALAEEDRVDLFNALEHIRATVARAEQDRKVCERSRVVGSNRFRVSCMTFAEREAIREQTRQALGREMFCNESAAACTTGGLEIPGPP